MTSALKADAIQSEINMADSAYESYTRTGNLTGMAPHEMRDYIEVREHELRSLTLSN
jgi:hypothetical protein